MLALLVSALYYQQKKIDGVCGIGVKEYGVDVRVERRWLSVCVDKLVDWTRVM